MKTLHPMEMRSMHEHVEFARHVPNARMDFKQQAVDYSAPSNAVTFQETPAQWELPVAIKDRVPSIGECLHMLHDFPDLISGTAMVSVRPSYNVAMATPPDQCLPVPEMYQKSDVIMDPSGGQGSSDDSVDWINDDLLHDVENTLEKMLTQQQQPPLISAANIKVEPCNQQPLNECISYDNHKTDTAENKGSHQMPQLLQTVPVNEQHHTVRQEHRETPQNAQQNTDARTGLRPRKKRSRSKRQKMLWQFLLDILANPNYNPELITWINRQQGIFRFVQSRRVAQLWGDRRQRDMSYENMSRAMRHYYAANIMRRVDGRRLHYQFLENAKGWQEMASYPEEVESST